MTGPSLQRKKARQDFLPLPTLLSQALVAFTIELDNEFEQRMPHWTTESKATADTRGTPWLVSLVMYSNVMRLLPSAGVSIGELERLARTSMLNLAGLERWGYLVVAPAASDTRRKPHRRDWLVRPSANGRKAQRVWRPLFGLVEQRWRTRFGKDAVETLREALFAVAQQLKLPLPDAMPILGYGLFSKVLPKREMVRAPPAPRATSRPPLSTLLARVLLAFTLHFERDAHVSLAIGANVLRLLGEEGAPLRDLPRLAGVSTEGMKMALSFLEKRRYLESVFAGKVKLARLTTQGSLEKEAYVASLGRIEAHWHARFGVENVEGLRAALEVLVGEPGTGRSPLLAGLEPPPEGWRAAVPRPETLPHHPMVLHRGGFPDGA